MPVTLLDFTAGDIPTAGQMDRLAEAANPYTAYTPGVTNVTCSARAARYLRHGDKVVVDFSITLSAAPTGTIQISLPVTPSAALGSFASQAYPRGVCALTAGAFTTPGFILIDSSTTVRLLTTSGDYFNASTPVGMGNTHIINGRLEYEAA